MSKKIKDATVLVPHFTEDGERAWSSFRFSGYVSKRQIKRAIRKSFKASGHHVHTVWLQKIIQRYTLSGPVVFQHSRVQGDAPEA